MRHVDALWLTVLLSVPFIVGFATYALHMSLLIGFVALAVCLTANHMETRSTPAQRKSFERGLEKGRRNGETDSSAIALSDSTAFGVHGRGNEGDSGLDCMEPAHGQGHAPAPTRRFVVCGRRHTPRSIRQTL